MRASSSAITTRNWFWVTRTSLPLAGRLSLARSLLQDLAPVLQPAERAASKTVQCGFESHPGHSAISHGIGMTPNPRWGSGFCDCGTKQAERGTAGVDAALSGHQHGHPQRMAPPASQPAYIY